MRIGLLTGGGNMAGVNAAVRAVVQTSITRYGSEVVGIMNGFEGLLQPPQVRSLGLRDVTGFVRRAGSILGTAPRGNPFETTGESRRRDPSEELLRSFRWLGLDGLICIGGLGTIALAHKISRLGIPIVAIPKSTTNELRVTDVTIGYETAVSTAVSVIDRLHSVEEQGHQLLYVQVMGRDAGWTALSAGIAGGAHVVLIPELPYELEEVQRTVARRIERDRPSTIIVVASGARPRSASADVAPEDDAVKRIAPELAKLNGLPYEVTMLGPIQRGGEPCSRDRFIATRFGAHAALAVHEGHADSLVVLRGESVTTCPLSEAVGTHKSVEPSDPLLKTAVAAGLSLGVEAGRLGLTMGATHVAP